MGIMDKRPNNQGTLIGGCHSNLSSPKQFPTTTTTVQSLKQEAQDDYKYNRYMVDEFRNDLIMKPFNLYNFHISLKYKCKYLVQVFSASTKFSSCKHELKCYKIKHKGVYLIG